MNIYLAARYSSKERLQKIALNLIQMGFGITSTWIYSSDRPDESQIDNGFRQVRAVIDYHDLGRSHILVLDLLDGQGSRGGQWVELGIALGQNLKVLVVGETENVFAYHPKVTICPNWDISFQELLSFKQLLGA